MGLKRLHDHPAVWSIYTPIDCGACTPEQAYQATQYIDRQIPHIDVEQSGYQTISTSDWMPYAWSINNVAAAEVMHTALAYFEAGRADEGYQLMKANILDQMYYGQSPANFGQIAITMLLVASAIATLAIVSASAVARCCRDCSASCRRRSMGSALSVRDSPLSGIVPASEHLICLISSRVRMGRCA
jgi:hypothetical protein